MELSNSAERSAEIILYWIPRKNKRFFKKSMGMYKLYRVLENGVWNLKSLLFGIEFH